MSIKKSETVKAILCIGIIFVNVYLASPLIVQIIINDLLGGRGWWLVKGALVRGPFLFPAI
jgi:hypothetical protein